METRQVVMLRDAHFLGHTHAEGDVVEVLPARARELVASGVGRYAELAPEDLEADEPPSPVKLRGELFIHGHTYRKDEVLILPADRARELVEMRSADPAVPADVPADDRAAIPAPFGTAPAPAARKGKGK